MRTSNLESAGDRFLSLSLQYALDEDWLSAPDLNDEFPAEKLMTALEANGDLRARLLVEAAGVHEKIAPKKSTSAAAEDLQIALDEGICSPATVLEIVNADDHVRYLDRDAVWELVTRDQFWFQEGERGQARMLEMIRVGLDQELLDLPRLVRAVTPEQLASDLPRDLVESALSTAIHAGLDGQAFDAESLLETLNLEAWIEHLPLAHFWDAVVKGEIAASASLGGGSPSATGGKAPVAAEPKPKAKAKKKAKGKAKAAPAASPTPAPVAANDAEKEARARAVANLKAIDRLPKNPERLASPILLGLDSMYEELLATDADEDRAEHIRDAFPNPQMLTEALYAMAETLDDRLTEAELRKRGADTNAIIQLILFEERRKAAQNSPKLTPSSPPPAVNPGSIPPPPASSVGVSGVPPLPPQARRASAPPPSLPSQARKAR